MGGDNEGKPPLPPERNPDSGRCSFYLPRKRRFCRMEIRRGSLFCAEHDTSSAAPDGGKLRVPCPYDPSHTVCSTKLAKHLKKCNARPRAAPERPVYFIEGINAHRHPEPKPTNARVSLKALSAAELQGLIARVQSAAERHTEPVVDSVHDHPVVRAEIEKCTATATAGAGPCSHLEQQASLIGNMAAAGLLGPHRCYVEFGAGRGKLLWFIHCAVGAGIEADYLAIDRMHTRQKFDRFFQATPTTRLERVNIDIEHLDLKRVPLIQRSPHPLVAVGKHLCGAATDLTLTCLTHCKPTSRLEHPAKRPRQEAPNVDAEDGVVIALCCHQVCTWESYCNQSWFTDVLGFTEVEFRLIALMSSWYVCGTRSGKTQAADPSDAEPTVHASAAVDKSTSSRSGLTKAAQERVGYLCKRLIDTGRVHFLRDNGYNVRLVRYTSREHTLENVALLAMPTSKLGKSVGPS